MSLSTRPGGLGEGAAVEGELQLVVGENLRRMRQRLGQSQESFGLHLGWHRTFVGAVERGERNLTLRTIERLAEQLEVHPLALLFDGVATFAPIRVDGTVVPVTFAADGSTAVDPMAAAPLTDPGFRRSRPGRS
jgi:DNA-binding XRE family transcriptional regulator